MQRRALLKAVFGSVLVFPTLGFSRAPQKGRDASLATPLSQRPIRPLYLTMDDGYEHVDTVIKELEETPIPVTFFPTGSALREHPAAWKKLYAMGFEFGCHTYDHPFASRLTLDQFRSQLKRFLVAYTEVLGEKAAKDLKYFRFPYGDSGGSRRAKFRQIVEEEFGWHIIGWDLSLSDVFPLSVRSHKSVQDVTKQFAYRVGQRDIVLMHFVKPDYLTLADLQREATRLHYKFTRLSEHEHLDKAGVVGR